MSSTTFTPAVSDLLVEVYERCGIRAVQIETDHIISARRSMNLTQVRWANRGINLFKMTQILTPLIQGRVSYAVTANTMDIFDVYRRLGTDTSQTLTADAGAIGTFIIGVSPIGGSVTPTPITTADNVVDTMMSAISRSDYASLPDKFQQSVPTSYWFNKAPASGVMEVRVWPAPDGNGPYYMLYWSMLRIENANVENGATLDLRWPFYEAFCCEVAAHLSVKWQPSRTQGLALLAKDAWQEASAADTERVPFNASPDLSAYFDT